MSNSKLLEVANLHAYYGDSHVLHGLNFDIENGQTIGLIGRNGAGKTTTLKSIMGVLEKRTGSVKFNGTELINLSSDQIARLGIAYCPEDRGIFAGLNVHENLMLPPVIAKGGMSIADIHQLFPNLLERQYSPGTKLSGGEQQMLAIARILRTGAKVLLLDEPTEGLAPVIVNQIADSIMKLKKLGYTIILVEQNYKFALSICDKLIIIENGNAVDEILKIDFEQSHKKIMEYLGV